MAYNAPMQTPADLRKDLCNDNRIAALLCALVAATPLVSLFGLNRSDSPGYEPQLHMDSWMQMSLWWLLALWLWLRRGDLRLCLPPLLVPMLALFGWAALSMFWALDKHHAIIALLRWAPMVLAAVIFAQLRHDMRQLMVLMQMLFWVGMIIAAIGALQYWFPDALGSVIGQNQAPASTFGNRNFVVQFLLLCTPCGLVLFLLARDRIQAAIYAFGSALMLAFFAYSGTRAGLIASIAQLLAIIAWAIYERRHGRAMGLLQVPRRAALALGGLLFVVLLHLGPGGVNGGALAGHWQHSSSIVGDAVNSRGTVGARFAIWSNSMAMWHDNNWLTGVGMGNWRTYYPKYQQAIIEDAMMSDSLEHANAHNDYIEVLNELGLVGLALLLWLMIGCLCSALVSVAPPPRPDDAESQPRRLGILCMILGMLGVAVDSLFSFPLQLPLVTAVLGIYVGILGQLQMQRNPRPRLGLPALWLAVAASTVAVGATAISWMQWQRLQAKKSERRVIIAARRSAWPVVLRNARDAVGHLPGNAAAYLALAKAYNQNGRPAQAKLMIQNALERAPWTAIVLANAVDIYVSAKEYDQAVEHLRTYMETRPLDPRLRRIEGEFLWRIYRNAEGARTALDHAMRLARAKEDAEEIQAINQMYAEIERGTP